MPHAREIFIDNLPLRRGLIGWLRGLPELLLQHRLRLRQRDATIQPCTDRHEDD